MSDQVLHGGNTYVIGVGGGFTAVPLERRRFVNHENQVGFFLIVNAGIEFFNVLPTRGGHFGIFRLDYAGQGQYADNGDDGERGENPPQRWCSQTFHIGSLFTRFYPTVFDNHKAISNAVPTTASDPMIMVARMSTYCIGFSI